MDELWDNKWKIFSRRVRIFRQIPFVDFVFLSGSMATGNIRENSDFDLIVGAREGKIFTTFFISALFTEILGSRESQSRKRNPSNKFGLNHFVTPKGYKLSQPYDKHWQELYGKIIPAFGDENLMAKFFKANDWIEPERVYKRSEFYLGNEKSFLRRVREKIFGGHFGNLIEAILRKLLTRRFKKYPPTKSGFIPRIVCNDERFEFL